MIDWADAVQMLIDDPAQNDLVKACYFDEPIDQSAQRFWKSPEWKAVSSRLPSKPGRALDLGAGRGISSYALARDGWKVTALEPDPSTLVGAGAIKRLAAITKLSIEISTEYSEHLPFADNSFDLVFCRQALHHSRDLELTCHEIFRVLKCGGIFMATREHVITNQRELALFLDSHPLHYLYGGENAYRLHVYTNTIKKSGLHLLDVIKPYDSPVNYYPETDEAVIALCTHVYTRLFGTKIARLLLSSKVLRRKLISIGRFYANLRNNSPGRLFSFIATKP